MQIEIIICHNVPYVKLYLQREAPKISQKYPKNTQKTPPTAQGKGGKMGVEICHIYYSQKSILSHRTVRQPSINVGSYPELEGYEG